MLINIVLTYNYNIIFVSYDTLILNYSRGKRNYYKCLHVISWFSSSCAAFN